MPVEPVVDDIAEISAEIDGVHRQAVRKSALLVGAMLRTRSQNKEQIAHTLDGLLDFCGVQPALDPYRRRCRDYQVIDPVAAEFYVDAYRTTCGESKDRE